MRMSLLLLSMISYNAWMVGNSYLGITSVLTVTRDNRQTPENAFVSGFEEHPE